MHKLHIMDKTPKKAHYDDIKVYDIGNSTPVFGEKTERFLNIKINNTDNFDDIINHGCNDIVTYSQDDVNSELRELFLEYFDRDSIRIFRPNKHKELPKRAQTFLFKLSIVINNNYQQVEPAHVEEYIHDLMDNVLREALFEDGTELVLMPCILRLSIGEESFAAYSDKEGRRGTEIIWVLDKDKHKFDKRWKKGDIQLIANMVAAAQTNRSLLNRVYPERILGIKFDADCVYFYSAYITEEYLNTLQSNERPDIALNVNKSPKDRELSLSYYEDRKEIFLYLSAFRKYAMRIDPVYT